MEGARDKVAHALATMGLSVLNGGSSTLLGVAFMAFSVTPIFKTLFLILSHTVRSPPPRPLLRPPFHSP